MAEELRDPLDLPTPVLLTDGVWHTDTMVVHFDLDGGAGDSGSVSQLASLFVQINLFVANYDLKHKVGNPGLL